MGLVATDEGEFLRIGCRFADRRRHVMDVCRTVAPPDADVDERRVKWRLYDGGTAAAPASDAPWRHQRGLSTLM